MKSKSKISKRSSKRRNPDSGGILVKNSKSLPVSEVKIISLNILMGILKVPYNEIQKVNKNAACYCSNKRKTQPIASLFTVAQTRQILEDAGLGAGIINPVIALLSSLGNTLVRI